MSVNDDKTRIFPRGRPKKANNESAPADQDLSGQVRADTTRFSQQSPRNGDRANTRMRPQSPTTGRSLSGRADVFPHAQTTSIVLKERFVLEKIIGVGGMGVVHKATDRLKVEARDKQPYVAIKMLNEEFGAHPEAFIALQRESRKTQGLAHPNIVKVYDFDKDGDVFFMTMEYMEGKPLNQLIKQYNKIGLPMGTVSKIIQGMCSALAYAHAESIIHADFKPGNIFVTTTGIAKIFDFGIARAVTNIEKADGWSVQKTVFDAASLGGLTPSYASYEMLKGEEPDIRDDIYALGCITYELLTGKHPFGKLPADRAKSKGLKPKRIRRLRKQQWKGLESALAFERKDRIGSVKEFYKQLTVTHKPQYIFFASVIMVASALGFAYFQEARVKVNPVTLSTDEMRSELEFNIRLDLYKEELEQLINDPSFTVSWEQLVWKAVQGVSKMLVSDDSWLVQTKETIFILYLNKLRADIISSRFESANVLIENAQRYSQQPGDLERERRMLAQAIARANTQAKKNATQRQAIQSGKKRVEEYNFALANVNKQLACRGSLNMRDFGIAVKKLRALNFKKYSKAKNRIIKSLVSCIVNQAKRFPERALESKNYALQLFEKSSLIAAIKIKSRDACDSSIAGLGAQGGRAVCRDAFESGIGPDLVVVPGRNNIKSFAIGKYEISIGEFKQYCRQSKQCSLSEQGRNSVPVTGLSVDSARGYLKWLTKKTGKKYRLPTRDEWVYAAAAAKKGKDPNRNCQFRSRGIQKGDSLVKTTTGKQNSWGLVNYLGNVQEWGYDKTGKLVAMGGAYIHAMAGCQISTSEDHSGQADDITGFRVLRELVVRF